MHIIIFIDIYTQLFTYIRIRYSRMIQIMIHAYTFMANYHIYKYIYIIIQYRYSIFCPTLVFRIAMLHTLISCITYLFTSRI